MPRPWWTWQRSAASLHPSSRQTSDAQSQPRPKAATKPPASAFAAALPAAATCSLPSAFSSSRYALTLQLEGLKRQIREFKDETFIQPQDTREDRSLDDLLESGLINEEEYRMLKNVRVSRVSVHAQHRCGDRYPMYMYMLEELTSTRLCLSFLNSGPSRPPATTRPAANVGFDLKAKTAGQLWAGDPGRDWVELMINSLL